MDVMQSPDKLLGHLPYLGLLQVLVVFDDIEELALPQLCHDDEFRVGLEGVQQDDNVGVL